MLKAAGAAIVFTAAALLGFTKAAALDREAAEIGTLCTYLQEFALLLKSKRCTTRELVRALAQEGQFAAFGFAQTIDCLTKAGIPFGLAVAQSLENFGKCYRSTLQEAVLPLGDAIGVQELQRQLSSLTLASRRLGRLHMQALERCRTRCGLYRRLGVFGGILVTIVLV